VDEVNLLPDHLVDVLLDAAAMGEAHVERDGVSVRHAARFLLVGTMNPEEGELRPQLLDRFGLTVDVVASREPRQRAEVVRRRLAYEADPAAFVARWAEADAEVGRRIAAAREALAKVVLPDAELERIARICAAFEVDGMRADLVTARAAIALAAWRGLTTVTDAEVRDAARLALPHRRRRNPFDAPGLDQEQLEQAAQDPEPEDGPEGRRAPRTMGPTGYRGRRQPDAGWRPGRRRRERRNPNRTRRITGPTLRETKPSGTSDFGSKRRAKRPRRKPNPPTTSSARSSPPSPRPTPIGPGSSRSRASARAFPGRRSAGRSNGRGRTVGAQQARARPAVRPGDSPPGDAAGRRAASGRAASDVRSEDARAVRLACCRPADRCAPRPRGEPRAVRGGRLRLDGRARAHVGRQGRRAVPAPRRVSAP
jgi:magnesium chelatase subunit D